MTGDRTVIKTRFEAGLAGGLDEAAAAIVEGVAVTGLRSRWLHRLCARCGHSFRVGDRVRVGEDGAAVHDMPGLCVPAGIGAETISEAVSADRRAFLTAMEAVCSPPRLVPTLRLEPGHPLLASPSPGLRRAYCRICGHTFRLLEQVVICPCDPDEPRCRVAVHRDAARQLHCWDDWLRAHPDAGSRPCLGLM